MVKFNKTDPYAAREASKYPNPIPSREFILEYLAARKKPSKQSHLIRVFDIKTAEGKEAMRRRLLAMLRDGQLYKNRKGAYGLLENMELVSGRVIGHKNGFGFVVPDRGGGDLFLDPRQMRLVLHGDRVLVRVVGYDLRGRREAIIVEVLERGTQQLVGRYFQEEETSYVEPANYRVTQDIIIPPSARCGAKDGQIVVVAITAQPAARARPLGKVIEVLGDHMAPGMEINVAICNHELPHQWPGAVLEETTQLAKSAALPSAEGRVDLRTLPFVTIDGQDAKDFDDAVYCERVVQEGAVWRLYVAIADVSYYVKPHTALDQEAYQRGNSVYFPGRVIPMLPEVLSADLCSLKPMVDRLVMVADMLIDEHGQLVNYQFYEAIICSQARLTYHTVHQLFTTSSSPLQKKFQAILPHLLHLQDLFQLLLCARQSRGAIDFNIPETKIVFSEQRKIDKIIPYERFESHRIIEECMLCANVASAQFLLERKQLALYRIHEGPNKEKIQDLRSFLGEMGLKLPGQVDNIVPANYAKFLQEIGNRPDAEMLQIMLLRSLGQAVYSPEHRGHFGLAYAAYTHFTSPIRRYPDLVVHRAIKAALQVKQASTHSADLPQVDYIRDLNLQRLGEHCSMTERRADDATREVIDWLKCEFMLDQVGQVFAGRISNVTGFGIFVTLITVYVEGLVHISMLPNDYYRFDLVKQALIGENTKRVFRIGQPIQIKVARVNLDQREIDFVLSET